MYSLHHISLLYFVVFLLRIYIYIYNQRKFSWKTCELRTKVVGSIQEAAKRLATAARKVVLDRRVREEVPEISGPSKTKKLREEVPERRGASAKRWLTEEAAPQRKVARPSIRPLIRPSIHPSIPSFIGFTGSLPLIHGFLDSPIYWFIGSLVH